MCMFLAGACVICLQKKHKPLLKHGCGGAARACRSKSKACGDVPSTHGSYLRGKCDEALSKVIYGTFLANISSIT